MHGTCRMFGTLAVFLTLAFATEGRADDTQSKKRSENQRKPGGILSITIREANQLSSSATLSCADDIGPSCAAACDPAYECDSPACGVEAPACASGCATCGADQAVCCSCQPCPRDRWYLSVSGAWQQRETVHEVDDPSTFIEFHSGFAANAALGMRFEHVPARARNVVHEQRGRYGRFRRSVVSLTGQRQSAGLHVQCLSRRAISE